MKCPVRKFCCKATGIILAIAVLLLLCGLVFCDVHEVTAAPISTEANRVEKTLTRQPEIRVQQRTIKQRLRRLDERLDRVRRQPRGRITTGEPAQN